MLSVQSAARIACEARGWSLSNLELQKVLYICHMTHLGRHAAPLVNERFEAWDYGPVLPSLYHHAKIFGKNPVKDIFRFAREGANSEEAGTINQVAKFLSTKPAAELVSITHWSKGAWAKHYAKGARSITIPDNDILKEYQDRMSGTTARS